MILQKTDLGFKLRTKRLTARLGLQELSDLLGGRPSMFTLHRLELGKTKFTPETRKLIKAFLKLPLEAIATKARLLGLGEK